MMIKIKSAYNLVLLSILILVLCMSVVGYGFEKLPDAIEFNHINIRNGLANNRVDCMLQDHEGYLWFGTKRGLCRYNGYEFRTFISQPDDTTSLRYHQISALFEDSGNILWVGTIGGGLHSYDRKRNKFTHVDVIPASFSQFNDDDRITNIISITENEILVNWFHGLTRIDINSKKIVSFKSIGQQGRLPGAISSVFKDDSGILLLAVQNSQLLYCYDIATDHIVPYQWTPGSKILPEIIHQIYQYDENNYWLAANNGLFNLNKATRKIECVEEKNSPGPGTNLNFVVEDANGDLWIGGDGLFLFSRENKIFSRFYGDPNNTRSVEDNIITCGLKDNQKNLWFGTFSRGVNVVYSKTKYFNPDKDLTESIEALSKNITAIYKSENNLLFLGTWDKGLLIIDGTNKPIDIDRFCPNLNFLKNKIIRTIANDKDKNIWIGTNDGLLVKFCPQRKSAETYEMKILNKDNAITSILFSGRDKIWVAGDAGVFSFIPVTHTFTEHKYNNTSIPSVMDMTEDSTGNIWAASYSTGLFRITRDGKITRVTKEKNENYNNIPKEKFVTIFRDSRNRIWAGSEFNGLFLFLPAENRFKQFTVKDGLPSNDICSIQEDYKGRLWIGTNNGLSRFNYSLNDFKNYFWSDGMNADEFHYNSNFTNADNLQYFGCTNGMVFFDPDEIQDSYLTLPVKIEEISINNGTVANDMEGTSVYEALATDKQLKLRYNQNTISFKFTTLNYSLEKNSHYAYQLQGLDTGFNYVDQQRQITYTNLPSGDYVFKVTASNNDNIWNQKSTELLFTIKTPPWLTWWAFISYFALFVLIIYVFRHMVHHEERMKNAIKMERIEKEQQEELTQIKLKFFTNISHEFKTPLTLIIGPLEELIAEQHGNSKLKQKLLQIRNNSQRLLRLINQLIDFRKMEHDALPLNKSNNDLVLTVQKTMNLFNDAAIKNDIRFTLNTGFEQLYCSYDYDKIEKVLGNILSNAFKYTHGGDISVTIGLINENHVQITIADTGIGMDENKLSKIFDCFNSEEKHTKDNPETYSSGIGMAYSKKLIELHRGILRVESMEGEGTIVTIQIPYEEYTPAKEKPQKGQSFFTNIKPVKAIRTENENFETGSLQDSPKILIVDDDDEIRAYIRSVLNNFYQVDEAADGQAGLDMSMNNDYDLIVIDVMLPKLSGTEMCIKLKSNINTSHIQIILLTAKDDMESELAGYKSGADSYIGKPFLPEQLTSVIANLLNTRKHIREYFTSLKEKESKPIGISYQDKELISNIVKCVEKNLSDEEFGVENLGKELRISRTHLYRKLKSLTGLSPNDYIRQIRLKKAAQLLKTGSVSISEVASIAGFKSPANFSTSFKAFYRMSPKEYLRKVIRPGK